MGRDDGRHRRRDGVGGAAPGKDGRVHGREEGWVEGDVFLDQGEHRGEVGEVNGQVGGV